MGFFFLLPVLPSSIPMMGWSYMIRPVRNAWSVSQAFGADSFFPAGTILFKADLLR